VPASGPSFSPFPFERLRRLSRADAAFETALARYLAIPPRRDSDRFALRDASPRFAKLAAVAESAVDIRIASVGGAAPSTIDPHAARAELRTNGHSIALAASSRAVRALTQRLLGGPDELDAPRPLTPVEVGIFCLLVAAAIADLGIDAQVFPVLDEPIDSTLAGHARAKSRPNPTSAAADTRAIELAITLGSIVMSVVAQVPRAIELRVSPHQRTPNWSFDFPIVLARAAIPRAALRALAVRDIVTVERALEIEIGDCRIGLRAAPKAIEATVATGYLRRDMTLPDDAHLELTVQLGTTRMSLRALSELAVGQIVSLGRPLAGPYEVRAGGRVVGHGELIDIDGELGVRIVSLVQE